MFAALTRRRPYDVSDHGRFLVGHRETRVEAVLEVAARLARHIHRQPVQEAG